MKAYELSNKIASMNKLKMVHFYQMFGENGFINGILAYYQDKSINLCDSDPQFEELLDRIIQLYQQESKENTGIIADEPTKKILEQSSDFRKKEYDHLVEGLEEIKSPLILPKAYSHVYLMPIIKYILKSLYFGKYGELTFEDRSYQWFGKGILEAMYLSKRLRFPFRMMETQENFYEISLLNVFQEGNLLRIDISFGNKGVQVSYYDTYYLMEGNLCFDLTDQGAKITHFLKEKEEVRIQNEAFCDFQTGRQPTDLLLRLSNQGKSEWLSYEFPWGATFFMTEESENHYHIYFTEDPSIKIGFLVCGQNISKAMEKPICFGQYSLHSYERTDLQEVHFYDMEYPRNSYYQEFYAGKYYTNKN